MEILPETLELIKRVASAYGFRKTYQKGNLQIYASDTGSAGINIEEVDKCLRSRGERETIQWLLKEKFK